ncbi:hypothetical protein KIH87_13035 [Paraneptunicella aestuarii]|uniref:hypothetical protein n=1 Tax=Paraneptunicella aestuarii TaxID=2831148 RepID=UPI001E338DAD|nr:hypothetical protein [Paraneptunicella aestuarii]UAA37632.1 hypothetical protein KIH87_13035 [Paraneptunicella aestuarii]
MKKQYLGRIAAATFLMSFNVSSGTLDGESLISLETVSVELASTGRATADVTANSIVINPDYSMGYHFRIYITLTNGATFADSDYVLEQSTAGAATGSINDFVLINKEVAGSSELEFVILTSAGIDASDEYILSGASVPGHAININLPELAAGETVQIEAAGRDYIGIYEYYDGVDLFSYMNEFSASVDVLADAVIDRNSNAQTFTNGNLSDQIVLDFSNLPLDNKVSLRDKDLVRIELQGDMSNIESLVFKTGNIVRGSFDLSENQGQFSASASDAFAFASNQIIATLNGEIDHREMIKTRSFMISTVLEFSNGHELVLIDEKTDAGRWKYNGLQAKVPRMQLNESGSSSWITLVNEEFESANVSAEVRWYIDGSTQEVASYVDLGEVPGRSIITVTEDVFLQALGNPLEPVEVFITFTSLSTSNQMHVIAEKNGVEGRFLYPVLYDSNSVEPRAWLN